MKRRIYYYDTDCGGVVYHANYLNYFEEARTEALEQAGLSVSRLMQDGCYIVVSHQEVFYKYPAFYGDTLNVEARAVEITPIRILYQYQITNQSGRVTTIGATTLVCVNKEGAPAPWPPYVKEKITLSPKILNARNPK
jgi:acyl-CoA thioester hydrolase